jgi:hypothetical protein
MMTISAPVQVYVSDATDWWVRAGSFAAVAAVIVALFVSRRTFVHNRKLIREQWELDKKTQTYEEVLAQCTRIMQLMEPHPQELADPELRRAGKDRVPELYRALRTDPAVCAMRVRVGLHGTDGDGTNEVATRLRAFLATLPDSWARVWECTDSGGFEKAMRDTKAAFARLEERIRRELHLPRLPEPIPAEAPAESPAFV